MHRIAHVVYHTSPLAVPGRGAAGGLNVHVSNVAARMAQSGIQVDIYTRRSDENSPDVSRLGSGARLVRLPAGPPTTVPKRQLPACLDDFAAELIWHIRMTEPDVIHTHYWMAGITGHAAAAKNGVPHVHTSHTLAVDRALPDHGDERYAAERMLAAEVDLLIGNTSHEAAVLQTAYRANPERITVIPPGVDHKLFRPGSQAEARVRIGQQQADLIVLFLGRIQRVKGADLAVATMTELSHLHPWLADRLTLLVVGGTSDIDGPATLAEMRAVARDPDLRCNIAFLEARPHRDIVDLYRAADVCLVPSRSESFGLVALEAQACGVPVVATAVGGLPHVVRAGQGGVLVDQATPGALADALARVLADDESRRRMSMLAREHASSFTWGRTVARHAAAYSSLRVTDGVAVCG